MDRELNLLKNRVDSTADAVPLRFSALTRLRWPATVEERARSRWSPADSASVAQFEGTPVMIEGYLAIITNAHGTVSGGVHTEDAETPNCGATSPTGVDWHIWFNGRPRVNRAGSVVIEMTPRVRERHPTWTTAHLARAALDGRRVRVTGWLMLDQEHAEQLHATAGGTRPPTRGTLWEIHPVMALEVEDDNGEFVALDVWVP